MNTVALVGPYGSDVLPLFRKRLGAGYSLIQIPDESAFDLLGEADYLVLRVLAMNRETIGRLKRTRLIQRWGVGFDKVDIVAAGERGIAVAIAPGGNASPVSELALLLMLSLYRNLIGLDAGIRRGEIDKQAFLDRSFMIRGKTVGLLGCGAIGQQVARKVQAFGAEVLYYDPRRLPEPVERELGIGFASFDQVVAEADILSLHLPLTTDTRGCLGEVQFATMKPTSVLINTARGEIVDTAALLQALVSGKIAGAGLDVTDPEPLPAGHPLAALSNVVLTPHVAGNTADMSIDMVEICARNIEAVTAGRRLADTVLVNGQYLA